MNIQTMPYAHAIAGVLHFPLMDMQFLCKATRQKGTWVTNKFNLWLTIGFIMDYNDTGIYVCILYNYLIKIKNKKTIFDSIFACPVPLVSQCFTCCFLLRKNRRQNSSIDSRYALNQAPWLPECQSHPTAQHHAPSRKNPLTISGQL